jgi:hypothetical protein
VTASSANINGGSCSSAPTGSTQTTTITNGALRANDDIILVQTTALTTPWIWWARPGGVTAGSNGTGAITITFCNPTATNRTLPAMTFDFIATGS